MRIRDRRMRFSSVLIATGLWAGSLSVGASSEASDPAWAVGDGGLILHNPDSTGSGSWSPQTSPTSHLLLSVEFIDDQNGWAVGGRAALELRSEREPGLRAVAGGRGGPPVHVRLEDGAPRTGLEMV